MSRFYTLQPLAIDGEVAEAKELNDVNISSDTAFTLVATEFDDISDSMDAKIEVARKWAEEAEDVEVSPGSFSSLHWSLKSEDEAIASAASAAASLASKNASAASAAAALASQNSASASASTATTQASTATTQAGIATTQAGIATTKASEAAASAVLTAADRVQTGLDRVATGQDKVATAADRVQTGLDRTAVAADLVATNQDTIDTAADAAQTALDAIATAADRVQTGLDAVATAADRVQTGLDVIETAADVAFINTIGFGTTGSIPLPAGTTAQRPVAPVDGHIRYNEDTESFEGYVDGAWAAVGQGATGAAQNPVFYENDTNVTGDYTITAGKNAMSAGPITIDAGVSVTVPDGSVWTVV